MQLDADTTERRRHIGGADRVLDPEWPQARWARILDRIDHRQSDVGLRFWGPPLWLEVTMTGPDSDLWPAVSEQASSWDWQSNSPCQDVAGLAEDGADDDDLLDAAARYTIENLILNAVHEIGEWLRFDGQRVYPAHRTGAADPSDQGNGAVELHLAFAQATRRPPGARGPAPSEGSSGHLLRRLNDVAAASRFTYLPGTTISYEAAGPAIHVWVGREPGLAWRSTWSTSTLDAAGANDTEALALIAQDIHRALVWHEADRICRAFHVDRRRCWRLAVAEAAPGANPPDSEALDAGLLSVSISYADARAAPHGV